MGYLDDLILVPLGIVVVIRLIPPEVMAEHRDMAAAAVERPVSRVAAIVVIGAWVVAAAVSAGLLAHYFAL